MSKKAKYLLVFTIVFVLIAVSVSLIVVFSAKNTVTLDYGYAGENNLYLVLTEKHFTDTIEVKYSSFYAPPTLTRSGYTFAGWYRDIGNTVAWINGVDKVTKDITLYAKWVKNT